MARKKEFDSNKIYMEKFDSISKLMRVVSSRGENDVFKNCNLHSQNGRESFTKTKNYEEAVHLLNYGWTKHLDEIKSGVAKIKSLSYKNTTKIKTDVIGYSPCVPRAIQGLPDSMYNMVRSQKKVSTISLTYEMGVSANVGTNSIINAGITLLSMVNILEKRGVKVELNLSCGVYEEAYGRYPDEVVSMVVCMKKYRDNLDLKKLIFPLIHPSMLRRIFFRYVETSPKITNPYITDGYGRPVPASDKVYAAYKNKIVDKNKNEYLINFSDILTEKFDPMKVLEKFEIVK